MAGVVEYWSRKMLYRDSLKQKVPSCALLATSPQVRKHHRHLRLRGTLIGFSAAFVARQLSFGTILTLVKRFALTSAATAPRLCTVVSLALHRLTSRSIVNAISQTKRIENDSVILQVSLSRPRGCLCLRVHPDYSKLRYFVCLVIGRLGVGARAETYDMTNKQVTTHLVTRSVDATSPLRPIPPCLPPAHPAPRLSFLPATSLSVPLSSPPPCLPRSQTPTRATPTLHDASTVIKGKCEGRGRAVHNISAHLRLHGHRKCSAPVITLQYNHHQHQG
ncbi:hypothetical protein E2C01_047594 [Portunus trituberculatus]|uniref:Uncharacterized protein n=1 Tax=Portunus trituberculatus TaxID=210409 RepID=A0A5B7G8B6_PORTR|nr:hypothetical protein [Portunus trituberculatus]